MILLLGKGHEKFISLEVGQRDYEGDKAIALKAIKRVYEGEEENELQQDETLIKKIIKKLMEKLKII